MALLFEQGLVSAYAHPKTKSWMYWLTEMKVKKPGTWFKYDLITAIKTSLSSPVPLDEFLKDNPELYIEDGVLYEMPHCVIYLANDSEHIEWFKTKEELDEFMEELESKFPHVKV